MPEETETIFYYKRGDPQLTQEAVLGQSWLKWAYQCAGHGFFETLVFRSSWLSRIMGMYCDLRLSRRRIRTTIAELEIDIEEFHDAVDSFRTFNEFFTRRLNLELRPFDPSPETIISPADGRVLVYPRLERDRCVPVKGRAYSADDLLAGDAGRFHGGAIAVIRLCPADYHRFHFPCSGRIIENRQINGHYHSVNPLALALGVNVFPENKRAYSTLKTEGAGRVVIMEIGAFGVGSIAWTYHGDNVEKMGERGFFKFGGSSIVLLFEPDRVVFAADLVAHSAEGHETLVRVGETIATATSGK